MQNSRQRSKRMSCNYQGHEFGANYLDSVCIDGFLWDADSGDSEGLSVGGDIPCPKCNHDKWVEYQKFGEE